MTAPKTDTNIAWESFHQRLARQRQEVLDALQQALDQPPQGLKEETDVAERALVRMRDSLIDWLRGNAAAENEHPRDILDRVNSVLSLLVGVEYSAGGIHRQPLKEARAAIKKLRLAKR